MNVVSSYQSDNIYPVLPRLSLIKSPLYLIHNMEHYNSKVDLILA